ncbi:hypothetical protein [Streptomyces canus]|uniref:hypothetical protein n=1 Tax=Streptomyces canus TaxID=58343 RepID=UPI0037FDC595
MRLATENDVLEFRRWRREDAEETIGEATWDRDAAAIGGLYDYLAQVGYVSGRPWRATGRGKSLGSGVSRDPRVRHMELDHDLFSSGTSGSADWNRAAAWTWASGGGSRTATAQPWRWR